MARTGVSFFDVSKAATAIADAGATPTVDRVRERLGTGSKSTIAPLLKQWKSSHEASTETNGIPQQLLDAVESLYKTNQDLAEERIQEITDEAAVRINDAQQKTDAIEIENKQLNDALEQLTQEQNETTQQFERLTGDHQNLNDQLTDRNALLASQQEKINRLETDKHELKLEVKTVRSHFEHYQQQMAEDRLIEREQAQTALQLSQQHAHNLSSQIDELKNHQKELIQELQSNKQKAEETNKTLNAHIENNAHLSSNLKAAEEDIKKLKEQKLAIEQASIELEKALNNKESQHAQAREEITKLTTSNAHINEQLSKNSEKLTTLEVSRNDLIQQNADLNAMIKLLNQPLSSN